MAARAWTAAHRAVVTRHTALVELKELSMRLRLITSACEVYHAHPDHLPEELGGLDPFWGFVWPGSWGIAHHLRAQPGLVTGCRVLDFASGCGISAIAAAMSGATHVVATEIDPLAGAAITINAELNDCAAAVTADVSDWVGTDAAGRGIDVILAGDILYDEQLSRDVAAWLRGQAEAGVVVLLGDPGRSYLPASLLQRVAAYDMPHGAEAEDQVLESKGFADTGVWTFVGLASEGGAGGPSAASAAAAPTAVADSDA